MAKGWTLPFQKRFERFIKKIDINISSTSTCWTWAGFKNPAGYGRYKWQDRKNWLVHRLMYMLIFGDFDYSLDVCHTCDNALCVRPLHLFLGTAQDNMNDMKIKGRGNSAKGENNKNAKLTSESVKMIRNLASIGWTQEKIGQKFNVSHPTIGCILRGETWKQVPIDKHRNRVRE